MPLDALPEHLRDIEHNFPDDSQYGDSLFGLIYRWYQKRTKTWFAFSYRCTEKWARWRKLPLVLLAIGGDGLWRFEKLDSSSWYMTSKYLIGTRSPISYLSRVQYFKRWAFVIQWPLMVSFHFYPKAEDVPDCWNSRPNVDGKVWFFYWNHFDADLVYWMLTSIYLGRNWK